jgi:hypothetical protein
MKSDWNPFKTNIDDLNNPELNKYQGIKWNDWITPGEYKNYHVFRLDIDAGLY